VCCKCNCSYWALFFSDTLNSYCFLETYPLVRTLLLVLLQDLSLLRILWMVYRMFLVTVTVINRKLSYAFFWFYSPVSSLNADVSEYRMFLVTVTVINRKLSYAFFWFYSPVSSLNADVSEYRMFLVTVTVINRKLSYAFFWVIPRCL
jgi:hypothetical protein